MMVKNVKFTLTRDMLPFDRIKWLCFIVFTLFRGGIHIKNFARILLFKKHLIADYVLIVNKVKTR